MRLPLNEIPLQSRVVIRHRLPDGATDSIGELAELAPLSVTVTTRTGPVTIDRERIIALRVLPPAATRSGPPHQTISIEALRRVLLATWPPVEQEPLGQWTLGASSGWTRRANSVHLIGEPQVSDADARARIRQWYEQRNLPALVTVAGPLTEPLTDNPWHQRLGLGERIGAAVWVMTARTRTIAAGAMPTEVTLNPQITPEWAELNESHWQPDVPAAAPAALAVMNGAPAVASATISQGGQPIALGRMGAASSWGVLTNLGVHPEHRRRGHASTLVRALAHLAQSQGIAYLALQVEQSNDSAVQLYRELGFTPHHQDAAFALGN